MTDEIVWVHRLKRMIFIVEAVHFYCNYELCTYCTVYMTLHLSSLLL